MKKLPYGISDYERLIEQDYYYVDKTKYIEKLENLAEAYIMFLRPRKFGKTLFTSMIENYYDVNKKDEFEKLYSQTYIGKNPTKLKNSYHILRFNFSGISTDSEESTIKGFKSNVMVSINYFVQRYKLDFYVNREDDAENILDNLFMAFSIQKPGEKIYVIIDEYDHFANELLSFNTGNFKKLVSKNGKVRKWYEILKKGTESVVDRIFITGVAPITLDSLTSGFNISKDITRDMRFNSMMGFDKEELIELMKEQSIKAEEQEALLPILKENYDGYKFSLKAEKEMYNSNMCLYFFNEYKIQNEIPEQLIDVNIASDYAKIGKMLELYKGEQKKELIEKTVTGEEILSNITEKFNPEIEFGEKELASMLFYLGYLTISGEDFGIPKLRVPNKVIKNIYADYFMQIISKEANFKINDEIYMNIMKEMALEGKIDTIVEMLQKYLNNLSNRDYQRFDEKYVKVIFYSIAMNLETTYRVKSEFEVNRKYPDLLLLPKDWNKDYYSIMIEFKYLKANEKDKLEEKQKEAKEQIKEYGKYEEIKAIEKLEKYTVVAVNDEIYIEKC